MAISNCTLAAACLSLALNATPSVAGEIFEVNGAAISGYDPVSYFSSGGPIKGSPEIKSDYKGATFHFATVKNRTLFVADPQKYVPQYGGYCAYGTARGYKAPTEPHAFTLVGGKLYLNYDAAIQESWRKDKVGYISKADKNWPAVKDQ
ncbi:tat pathway signal sequence domain protein [Sinorhizobium medicae]|uniref:Tat pathway signal sequence domain protein n=1 Tax=Sinorhizobium medicae TaxID=110321 RepID=A0A508X1J1_9HYPH|nr:YHS domain-containing (seleno)protein [Sinorhizobium medicae]MBO1961609.1 YHS domain-containing protein [Sinorhizobium medicae]MDX0451986.1 YHS domain-containing protein [Sinorhizobium medicae]MDX0513651.1 YHS domain-containing protein [Sinorhizobium medicae]MDX0520119.1 YHS domain-containing protein [Sinorhizobium medicae]MDX0547301.1 YHS domain-containing protein [Sinorhizobium medicae]